MTLKRYLRVQEKALTVNIKCLALDTITELDKAKTNLNTISQDADILTSLQLAEIQNSLDNTTRLFNALKENRQYRLAIRSVKEQLAK